MADLGSTVGFDESLQQFRVSPVTRNFRTECRDRVPITPAWYQKFSGSKLGPTTNYPDSGLWWYFTDTECKCPESTLKSATKASFHILSNLFPVNHLTASLNIPVMRKKRVILRKLSRGTMKNRQVGIN